MNVRVRVEYSFILAIATCHFDQPIIYLSKVFFALSEYRDFSIFSPSNNCLIYLNSDIQLGVTPGSLRSYI